MAANQQQFMAPPPMVVPQPQTPVAPQQQVQQPAAPQQFVPQPTQGEADLYNPNTPFQLGSTDVNQMLTTIPAQPAAPQQFVPQPQQQQFQPQQQYQQPAGFAPNGIPIPAGNLPIVPPTPAFMPQTQQQTMAWNQLNTMQQQAQMQGQQLAGADTNNPVIQAMLESNKQTQAALQQLIESQRVAVTAAQKSNEPNYLEMDNQELAQLLLGDPDSGQAPKVKEILAAVAKQAGGSVNESLQQELQQMKSLVDTMTQQHTTNQVKMQISTMQQKYQGRDPMFDDNMVEAARFLESPQGKAYFNMFPEGALETAYLTVQARKINDPNYQQALASQVQQQQYAQHQQKLQGGMQGGYTQTAMPYPAMQSQVAQPQGKSDFDVIADILRVGGHGGFNVPNVRPVMAA